MSFSYQAFPTWRDLSRIDDRCDFIVEDVTKSISLDYDLKRKPRFETLRAEHVEFDGGTYEVACFETEPWDSVGDYTKAKEVADQIRRQRPGTKAADGVSGCLRTVEEWKTFQRRLGSRVRMSGHRPHVSTAQADSLKKLVAGWREGEWSIPTLDAKHLTVAQKIEWLSHLGYGEFTRITWDNICKRDRRKQIVADTAPEDVEEILALAQGLDVFEFGEEAA